MASISIDSANGFLVLNCGAGESDVTFNASAIYSAWKDWMLVADNSKYLNAMNSAGGNPTGGAESLDNVWFVNAFNGWRIAPQTVEVPTKILINGDLFPDPDTAELIDYSLAAGHCHIRQSLTTSGRAIETGTSGLLPGEAADLATAAAATPVAIRAEIDANSTRLDVAVSTRATPAQVDSSVATNEAITVEAGLTKAGMLRVMAAMIAGKYDTNPITGDFIFKGIDGTTSRIIGKVDPTTEDRTINEIDGS